MADKDEQLKVTATGLKVRTLVPVCLVSCWPAMDLPRVL